MQETNNITIQAPGNYDWSEFIRKERGFLSEWCRDHKYANGEEFNYKTVFALIKGDYIGEAGPKIREIIRAALAEDIIHEFTNLSNEPHRSPGMDAFADFLVQEDSELDKAA